MKIYIIPDTQCKPGIDQDFLGWIGEHILDEKPDIIVHIGDHWDLPSLSYYSPKAAVSRRNLEEDIIAGNWGMYRLLDPLNKLNEKLSQNRKKQYKPRRIFCMGNHEDRLRKYYYEYPEFAPANGADWKEQFNLDGWEVYDFLDVFSVNGWHFSHYFYNQNTGKPLTGTIKNRLSAVGGSFVQGHQQGLDMGFLTTNTGSIYTGIVCGSSYTHDEKYKGPQGNDHWRGVIILDNAYSGKADISQISMETLRWRYEE